MAIVHEASATNQLSGSSSDITINKPTGTASGDVLVAAIYSAGNNITDTPPSGWTQVTKVNINNRQLWLYYKVAGGSEPASYTWTASYSNAGGGIDRYSGVDNTTPEDATVTTNNGTGTSATYSGVTTSTDGAMLVGTACSNNINVAYTPPSGFTEEWELDRHTLTDNIQASAGASGDKTTDLGSSYNWATIFWALKPDGGGGAATGFMTTNRGFWGP